MAAITGTAILGFRGLITYQGLCMWRDTGGKLILTRGMTRKKLLTIASEFTGKTYKNSDVGMAEAIYHFEKLMNGKNLAEIGDVAIVNKEVGGVASDLQ